MCSYLNHLYFRSILVRLLLLANTWAKRYPKYISLCVHARTGLNALHPFKEKHISSTNLFPFIILFSDVSNLKFTEYGWVSSKHKQIAMKRSVHEQRDGTIYAICATGTSTKDSLLSWIRLLERNGNSCLGQIPVLFKFRSHVADNQLVVPR